MTHPENKTTVAAFDFDGTITYYDSLIHFLLFTNGYMKTAWKLLFAIPAIAAWGLGSSTRQKAKEAVIKQFFQGHTIEEMRSLGKAYAEENLPQHVRPEALKRIRWHQDQGHKLVLISASIDAYLEPWGKTAGFDHFVTSRLEVSQDNTVTGNLVGANCWGPEKCRRLMEELGPKENYTLYAYGDSRGDQELLEIADYGYYREIPSEENGGLS